MAVFDLDRTPIEIQSTKTYQDQQLPLGRLQTPREWNDRVPIEEYCIFNVAIPLKVEFEKKVKNYNNNMHLEDDLPQKPFSDFLFEEKSVKIGKSR